MPLIVKEESLYLGTVIETAAKRPSESVAAFETTADRVCRLRTSVGLLFLVRGFIV